MLMKPNGYRLKGEEVTVLQSFKTFDIITAQNLRLLTIDTGLALQLQLFFLIPR